MLDAKFVTHRRRNTDGTPPVIYRDVVNKYNLLLSILQQPDSGQVWLVWSLARQAPYLSDHRPD